MFVVFCHSVRVCTEWLDSRLPESGVHGVCPSSEVCVRPFEAGFWFQVARSQLAAFVGLKHSEALGFLKKQCHICVSMCIFLFLGTVCLMPITSYFSVKHSDELISH